MDTRSTVKFLLNGEKLTLDNPDPTTMLLDFLRDERRLTGTKEGCREGDCGACTVVQSRVVAGALHSHAINACIVPLPTIDGTAISTVEAVANKGELSDVQACFVGEHASQCGFCTPGFIMSLHAARHSEQTSDTTRISELLAGNLCRCTGYGPIIAAARTCLAKPPIGQDQAASASLAEHADASAMLRIAYRDPGDEARRHYAAPRSLAELSDLLDLMPDPVFLAGATDLGLWLTKQQRVLRQVIDINRIEELRTIERREKELVIGAAVTYSEARASLADAFPGIDRLISRIASEQIRNRGTIGGNVANGSPIGDMPPALIALGAVIDLVGPEGQRTIPVEQFYLAYGKQDRACQELLGWIRIPLLHPDARFAAYKISKRFDQDISAVCGAFHARMGAGRMQDVRLAFGGMAGTPKRAVQAEACLEGAAVLDEAAFTQARAALASDFDPLSDHRASASYRRLAAEGLLSKFEDELRGRVAVSLDREIPA